MDDEFATSTPTTSPKRASARYNRMGSRKDSSPDDATKQHRGKHDLHHLKRDLIDFDVIKGSAFFHTKPSNHDKKLVNEGIKRVLFVPFHASFWKLKPHFYEATTALYALHLVSIAWYVLRPQSMSIINAFEVGLPVVLLVLVAIGYGRVTSTLLAGDALEPALIKPALAKLVSPTKASSRLAAASSTTTTNPLAPIDTSIESIDTNLATLANATVLTSPLPVPILSSGASGIGSDLAESENSDSTDSDEDETNDDSSSDDDDDNAAEALPSALMFTQSPQLAPQPTSAAPSPLAFAHLGLPHTPRQRRESINEPLRGRRVTVCVWENGVPKKRAMTIAELRNTILAKVKATPPRLLYRKIAKIAALILSLVPLLLRLVIKCQEYECLSRSYEPVDVLYGLSRIPLALSPTHLLASLYDVSFGSLLVALSCGLCTYSLAFVIFSALADAEVTYHRRFLYAKCFTALTSSRRSRLMKLPHFRLKNVVNIKAWIALRGGRTWLKRQGRQRAADEIVSTSFLLNLVLLVVMGMQAVSEGSGSGIQQQSLLHVEVTMWCLLASIFMLRFMMLGSNINKKYQNTSLLLTEQMNVYLRLLVKPDKKEKLLVSNNVLKLASKLLKELNSPNKVSGLTMNPLLYNVTRVVVLSAFSSTASEFFGFKLKIWKLKAM